MELSASSRKRNIVSRTTTRVEVCRCRLEGESAPAREKEITFIKKGFALSGKRSKTREERHGGGRIE